MRWGLVPIWAKDLKIGNSLINARIETAAIKPAFRSALKERRCLVPASGYYEWQTVPVEGSTKPRKQPFYITRSDGAPFTFAGLWERWKDGTLSFTILTTEGTAEMGHLHDRMPVILDQSGFAGWLDHGAVERPKDFDTGACLSGLAASEQPEIRRGRLHRAAGRIFVVAASAATFVTDAFDRESEQNVSLPAEAMKACQRLVRRDEVASAFTPEFPAQIAARRSENRGCR